MRVISIHDRILPAVTNGELGRQLKPQTKSCVLPIENHVMRSLRDEAEDNQTDTDE